ncbi:MAG: MBL fold metallo-hydrolase [Thermodesulfovibrionia bacterium]
MILKRLIVGPLQENCYIVGDEETRDAIVIDPGDEADRIIEVIKENGLNVSSIICTHGHFDHLGAIGDIKREMGGRVLIHADEMVIFKTARQQAVLWGFEIDDIPDPDGMLKEGDIIKVGSLEFSVIHTPGHSPGGICLYGEGILFTGDTLFQDSVGRTDLPGGDMDRLKWSFRRLLDLPDETAVFPGHGPQTTIGRERRENLFKDMMGDE